MNLLRTILVILVIYYLIRFISRYVMPLILKKMVNNVEKKFNQQTRQYQSDDRNFKEGETIIDKKPRERRSNDNVGEYVDYEEVD
ncbi:MAG: DUF4834 domain-containing protein [Flavobacteriales bacterium]|nr:MAG: DUF4834 domain-containing protein [Flavobacteriales bacterium]